MTKSELIETSSAALSSGAGFGANEVRAALTRGRRAAELGKCIPLMPLLDLWAMLEDRLSTYRDGAVGRGAEYDDWIRSFYHIIRRSRQESGDRRRSGPQPDYLPFLIGAWPPRLNVESGLWAALYKEAEEERAVRQIHSRWAGRRRVEPQFWERLWPNAPGEPAFAIAPALWSLFAREHVHENFDHRAAEFYEETEGVGLSPNDRDLLKFDRSDVATDPLPKPPVEQDPHFGRTALLTLTMGDYGIFKIVNGSDPKLTDPVSDVPPRQIHVHLAWINCYAGIESGQASILHGLAAVILDDWRWALRGLPHVRFWAHRQEADFPLGTAGTRWSTDLKRGVLPPSEFVEAFFTRSRHVDADLRTNWKQDRGLHLWFAFVLKVDEIGLKEARFGEVPWDETPLRPGQLHSLHLVIVDPDSGDGEILQQRLVNSFRIVRRRSLTPKDRSFLSLRLNCLTTLFNAVRSIS